MPKNESTKKRYDEILNQYEGILDDLGDARKGVSRTYIYEKIQEKTGLSLKRIAYIINHYKR